MPPRHTYWTILFGNQPTAFRSAEREELLPTFKQIQAKHPDAVMMWFARGRLWKSPEEARETFDRPASARWPKKPGYGEAPPPASPKPRSGEGGGWRDRPQGNRPKPAWQNRDDRAQSDRPRGPKSEWQNRRPKPPAFARRPEKPGYGEAPPKRRDDGGGWRDKPAADRPRDSRPPRPEWRDKPQGDRPRGPRPEWQNRGPKPPAFARRPEKPGYGEAPPKRRDNGGEWRDKPPGDRPPRPRGDVPSGERPPHKGPDKRGRDWRPGGDHQDPRDRFKVPRDVKRARFKQNLQRERTNPRPPHKKKDGE